MDSRDVYGLIRGVLMIVVIDVGTQLHRLPVVTSFLNSRAGGGCYIFPSKRFVHVKVG